MKTRISSSDTINIITLGCSKNTVDSEKLMGKLSEYSVKVEYDRENSSARTVIINTCGFIADAKQESIDTILSCIDKKKNGEIDNLYVIGCLSQRYADFLRGEMPEVDKYFGVNCIEQVIESLGYKYKNQLIGERILTTPNHYAYLKISEGCNRKCSFCAIPLIRGNYESIPIDDLIKEATLLSEKGVKELMLIAQDISTYGTDIYRKPELAKLVEKLTEVKGIEWIRLHYAYPLGFPEDVLSIMQQNPKICKYLDIPVQHISDRMLKMMRRGHNKKKTIELISRIRETIPGVSLRTTLLVGHPGETKKEFEELENFVKEAKFERLGVFKYSHEEDTFSAKKYKDNVPEKVKQERADRIMELQQSISFDLNKNRIGNTYKTIIDKKEGEFYVGRTEFDSPEVDNEVLITSPKVLKTGEFYNVTITDAGEFDLFGKI
jgi:ribosomal protein S12 methylthiotransferase